MEKNAMIIYGNEEKSQQTGSFMETRLNSVIEKMKSKNIERNELVSLEEIKSFEKKNNIKLPNELVSFYTTISNGCKMIDGFNLRKLEEWKFKTGQLNRDFPFTEPWIWEDDENTEKLKYIEDGNIELIDIGDSQTWNIIVSGKEKGKMWFFTDVGIQPCAPAMDFLTWFEFWLDGNEDYF
ncbi:SMI1/KNR4 family protein [Treponema saccharophilum]|nr:SMI1/KNR4 family protein [Treponema saccharophilum]